MAHVAMSVVFTLFIIHNVWLGTHCVHQNVKADGQLSSQMSKKGEKSRTVETLPSQYSHTNFSIKTSVRIREHCANKL